VLYQLDLPLINFFPSLLCFLLLSPFAFFFFFSFLFWLVLSDVRRPQEGIDTSDAAYEKRHRKYEAFEKRQRLREKEKLKHEHYKLKERIEQLRALEPSTFLSAPDSFFAGSRRSLPHRGEPNAQDDTDAPAPPQNEGEWRKRQMLDVANSLEARYRTLLDTAPTRAPDLPTPTPPPPAAVPAASAAAPMAATPQAHTPNYTPTAVVRHSPVPTSPILRNPQRAQPLPPPAEIIELDSEGEEKTPEFIKVEPVPTHNDTTDTLKLRIKFPNRRPPPASAPPRADQRSPSPSSPRATATRSASASSPKPPLASPSPSPTRPRPKPIFKNPSAPPGPHARVPFAKRVAPQDAAAADAPSPLPMALSPQHTPASLPSITLPALRRRPSRAAAHPKPGSPATAAGVPSSPPQHPSPHAHAHGSGRPHKRPRVELSHEDDDGESHGLDTDDDEMLDGAEYAPREDSEEEEEEEEEELEEEEGADEDGRRQSRREQEPPRVRWRESALYREAQRHAGAPNARKTHRHLGIFGLKGFPAELEHLRDFMPPQWALPRGDPRVAEIGEWERKREVRRRDGAARGAEKVRGGGVGGGGSAGGGAMGGVGGVGGGDTAGVWQRRLRDAVAVAAVTADGEQSSSCGRSDRMMVVETASAVDSQATEVMI